MLDEFAARRHAEMIAEEARMRRAQPSYGWTWWQVVGAVGFLMVAAMIGMVLDAYLPKNPDPRIARDEKHLACRMMGQSWEHFGSLGWQCVPAEVKP